MEFCIEVFTENKDTLTDFRSPKEINTVWGKAIRAEEEGRLYWTDDLYITATEVKYLPRFLPNDRQKIRYYQYCISGEYINNIPHPLPSNNGEPLGIKSTQLTQLFERLTRDSDTWAIFFAAYCDDLRNAYSVTSQQAMEIIDLYVYGKLPAWDEGFYIVSK